MSEITKIALVNYLNSKPFLYGLKHFKQKNKFDIITTNPANCAELFKTKQVDISLIPVGALGDLDSEYRIISDFGISCDGEVRTVCIFSNDEIKDCQKIYLDDHSRTSFLLTKILANQYFKISPDFVKSDVDNINLAKNEAVLMIGDKVFKNESLYKYKYDLGILWKKWTGLPFVFAVWVAQKEVSIENESKLNLIFKSGLENIEKIIQKESSEDLDLYYYFSHNIQYKLDDLKMKGMHHFLEKVKSLLSVQLLQS